MSGINALPDQGRLRRTATPLPRFRCITDPRPVRSSGFLCPIASNSGVLRPQCRVCLCARRYPSPPGSARPRCRASNALPSASVHRHFRYAPLPRAEVTARRNLRCVPLPRACPRFRGRACSDSLWLCLPHASLPSPFVRAASATRIAQKPPPSHRRGLTI